MSLVHYYAVVLNDNLDRISLKGSIVFLDLFLQEQELGAKRQLFARKVLKVIIQLN